jgi:hypothetical protein
MNGKCTDYRVGEPCFSKKVEDDVSLYYEYNYGMSADLVNMKCIGEHFSAIMANSKRPVRDMTNVEYRKSFKGLVKRSDRCNGEFWAFGRFEEDGIKRKTLVERIREKDKLLVKAIHKLNNTINEFNDYTLWVIPTYKRAWTLDLVLKSLGKRNILVSKDSLSNEIDNVIQQYNVESITHPWSCSIHPNQFPARDESLNKGYNGDTYGNPRSPWATCLKHHWWWMMKQAWSRNPDRVCVLEDDTILHPQAFDWLYNHKGNIKLTPEAIAVPWCMDRTMWNRIEPKSFCEHDDYNWDQTIAWMLEHGHGPNLATVPSVPLSMHIGDCGGWDAGGRNKDCKEKTILKIKNRVDNWLNTRLSVTTKTVKWLAAHSKPNGGWGHPKDWAHCMGNDESKPFRMHFLDYVVVIPSVKRNNNKYLQQTLKSLEVAKPADVPVILVNANQPPEEHTYLLNWCSSHKVYKCIEAPPVPESLIQDVISNDKRGDTAQYLRWRTMEAKHAIFGMSEFLKMDVDYMIWLQDDVTVDKYLFSSLPDEEAVCLRSDGYCGMVAYMFKKSFIQKLIPNLQKKFKNLPIDWIVDQTRGKDVIRIPKAYHHGIISSNGKIRKYTKKEAIINTDSTKKTLPKIKTSDLFATIDYNAPENKGPWKQGWNYDYDGRFKDGLTIHVVPHSHNDPGWIKTYHNYYSTQTKHILNTVVESLIKRSTATFIWAEISYFSLWWKDATEQQKHQVKELVKQKRLDFVTGGWVMNDEACVTDRAIRWQLEEGLQWLQEHLGTRPQYSWAIDPFGHSAGQAHILKEMGYKGMLIQRVHYAIKKQLAKKQQLEFQWSTPAGNIFTHMMPFYSYDGPHTCGPDPSICCQFDFKRIGAGTSWLGCPWGTPPVSINEENVKEKSLLWLDQVYKKAMLYKNKHVLIPLGDDFRYQNMQEADRQFENYQKMFDWIHKHVPNVQASFSTLTHYFDSVVNNDVPTLEGSFFPYSDREKDYWTGYFNSRIFYKGYDRKLEATIAAAEKLCPNEDLHLEKQALALFQHHDGITGTAKSHVVQDYYNTMKTAVESANAKIKKALNIEGPVSVNPLNMKTPTHKPNEIKPFKGEPECRKTSWKSNYVEFDNGFLFAVNHVHVKERFVWRTNQGTAGAYLLSVSDVEIPLEVHSFESCETDDYIEMRTTFDMVTRVLRVYHDKTIEVIFEVDIRSRNNGELWAVYSIVDAKQLCSDVHGLTWECHSEPNAPLQAKFWPMPTMAWLESKEHKMTWITGQPTGVGFDKGKMIMILDRRGNRDDARGLGQGISDTVAVDMRFGLLMNEEHDKALRVREWILNPSFYLK